MTATRTVAGLSNTKPLYFTCSIWMVLTISDSIDYPQHNELFILKHNFVLKCTFILIYRVYLFSLQSAVSMLKQDFKEGEMSLSSALALAVKVLNKTMDVSKLSAEKGQCPPPPEIVTGRRTRGLDLGMGNGRGPGSVRSRAGLRHCIMVRRSL